MVELIIEESGFPRNRPNLQALQLYPQKLIDNLLRFLPGTRVISGFEITDHGNDTMSTTAGILAHKGKLYSIAATTTVAIETVVSFNEVTTQAQFNVGTKENPNYQDRDERITRTAYLGDGYDDATPIVNLYKDRTILESQKTGSTVIGPVVFVGGSRIVVIDFTAVPSSLYFVLGKFRPLNPLEQFTQPFSWNIVAQTKTSFTVRIENVSGTTGSLVFDWNLISRNFLQHLTTTTP